ncbi:uncharacterized protein LOC111373222 [Olea europaea var. sylvestris]|uniref:uncharacterized protein LOC111373222 n=1 Tax=Olea europaea var. sylvestris TaxID=158386 RepID=UPI000C1D811F|nr:uncharacterized protein LOC111373222 [Olea europaea var. sylvestris]
MTILDVCLLYGGHTSLILVNNTCTYDELVNLVISELGLNHAEVGVRLTYSLDSSLPLVRILSNNNVLTYLRLRSLDGIVSNYPITVDVITIDSWQSTGALQCPESSITTFESSANVFSLQQIAQDICDSVTTIENGNIEEDVTLISQANVREVVEGNVFRNKEVLKMSLALYAIQNKFEYKVLRSDKKEYKYTSSHTIYTPNDISNDMLHKYGVSMNIGTVTRIETDHLDRFKYYFMALGASIASWKYCRPVIVVDGTYLNGHYGGTLFTACTQDANNNIFILAFGIGENENDKSWRWFLEMLKRAYGSRDGLCIVSDRHNSIRNAIEFVYPEAMHGICSYHLLKNLKSHYAKSGHNVTYAFNSVVRDYTMDEFEYQMQQLDSINEDIRGYLS